MFVEVAMVSLMIALFVASTAAPAAPVSLVIVVPPSGQTQELVFQDGTRALGRVEAIAEDFVTFRTTADDVLEVERSQISAIELVTGQTASGSDWPADEHTTRTMFTPTARSLKRGEVYFGVAELSVPFVQIGITDRISLGGGTTPFFIGKGQPFWLTPKVQLFSGRKTQAAVGMVHLTSFGNGGFGVAYGAVTHGTASAAATVGVGYAYVRGFGENGGVPVLLVSGERRIGHRLKLLTDNYVFQGGGMVSAGIRIFGKHRAIDLGVATPVGGGIFYPFPIINLVRKF
jgi:hypothetical protein